MLDKSWLNCSRLSKRYIDGVGQFLDYAFVNGSKGGLILCPCKTCNNCLWKNRDEVYYHLICKGIDQGYTHWIYHGESSSPSVNIDDGESVDDDGGMADESNMFDNLEQLVQDVMSQERNDDHTSYSEDNESVSDEEDGKDPSLDAKKFFKLIRDGQEDLYPSCKKSSKLSFLIRLLNIKGMTGCSNVTITLFLELVKSILPDGETLPKSYNEATKIMKGLGLEYEKIDACPNDCMLYWGNNVEATSCHLCGASRWEENNKVDEAGTSMQLRKIPKKVLRYFPLKPRLQRLFLFSKTAEAMRWHEESRTKDMKLRHPADSKAWKAFDSSFPDFAADCRNVRLGLATDGFNPFKTMSLSYSIWPVILIPYNLPPWMCMKSPYFMLSTLIPGPLSPSNNIDVYLQPLVKELKELWEFGVATFDASSQQTFQMRAALMWTISDFPGYALLSGWSTKGYLACPNCNYETSSIYLFHSKKNVYMKHRRFLDLNHPWRYEKKSFDGTIELGSPPVLLSGSEVLQILKDFNNRFGKTRRVANDDNPWKKRSIFFELSYWEHNLLRHNLDVMHIEKNLFDSLLATLLDTDGKTKDHLNSRLDLQDLGIREELHPRPLAFDKIFLPPACFSMTSKEKGILCEVLKGMKLPDSHATNISRCVNVKERKISGLKSFDSHFLMHYVLPIAIRQVLPKHVVKVLIRLSAFFRGIYSKVIQLEEFERLEKEIAMILCELERIFPPSFFDIMTHLPIHLAREAMLGGPIQYRYMYPVERYLYKLKSYVRNKSHPEGCIAEGYLAEECISFCSRYLDDSVQTRFNRPSRNYDATGMDFQKSSLFPRMGRCIGSDEISTLDYNSWVQAHRCVLFNCPEIEQYRREHEQLIVQRSSSRKWKRARSHCLEFHDWFENRVRGQDVLEEIKWLSRGPSRVARSYKGFIINGFRFHTQDCEKRRRTQNSGVVVTALTESYASSRDQNPIKGNVTYYGVLKEIIELDYYGNFNVLVFKCDWFQTKQDEFGFSLVNFKRLTSQNDPFVVASQVQQVFYIQDPIETDWHVVVKPSGPRDLYDMAESNGDDPWKVYDEQNVSSDLIINGCDDTVSYIRDDIDGVTIHQ